MRIVFVALLTIFISANLFAQPIQISKKLTDIGIVNNSASAVAVQADKKIVVTGFVQEGANYKLAIIRYQQNGDLDNSFGKNGVDTFAVNKILPSPYQGANLHAVVIQQDGKIVVAGSAWYSSGVNFLSNVLLMRLNQNGVIDSSFGDNGTVRTNINSGTGLSVDDAFDLALQTDGKILIAGQTYDYVQHRFLLIRYNTDGSVDNSFATGGVNIVTIGTSDDEAFALSIQDDGKIILAGESYLSATNYRVAVMRFTAKGVVDKSFGANGIITTDVAAGADVANDVAVQTDGKIVIAGYAENAFKQRDVLCVRYRPNGSIDSSFNKIGHVIIDVNGKDDLANKIIVQPDDKILLGGSANTSDNTSQFLTIRLFPNGQKNTGYGDGGIQTTSLFTQGDVANGMSLSPTGKILLVGRTTNGASNFISLAQYKKNGSPDSSFKSNGATYTGIGSSEDIAYKMLPSPWSRSLFVAGVANGYWVIAKYKSFNLTLDSSFGLNGIVSVVYKNNEDPSDEPVLAIDAKKKKIYLAGYTNEQLTIVRFDGRGVQDKSFGTKGAATYSLSIFYGGFGIEADSKILLSGIRQQSISGYDFIARLNYNGTVDSSFGTNGEVQHLPITANAIQMKRDGSSILLGGRAAVTGIGVLSLKLNGSYDSSFGTNGLVFKKSGLATAQVFFKYNMAQDQSGKILLSGGVQGSNFKYQFSVTRFLKNGIIDSAFANKGLFVKDVSSGSFSDNYNEGISAFCVDTSCSILTSGIKLNDGTEQSHAVIIALKNNGTIDSLNLKTGYIDTSFFGDKKEALYAALIDTVTQFNEIMFVAGKANNGSNSDFEIIKLIRTLHKTSVQNTGTAAIDYNMNVTPNPAQKNVQLSYVLNKAQSVEIRISNLNGKPILVQQQHKNAGKHQANFTLPADVTPGIYIVTITTMQSSNSARIIVL